MVAAGGRMTSLLGWGIEHRPRDDIRKESYKNRWPLHCSAVHRTVTMAHSVTLSLLHGHIITLSLGLTVLRPHCPKAILF